MLRRQSTIDNQLPPLRSSGGTKGGFQTPHSALRISDLLQTSGLSQRALASAAGFSTATVSLLLNRGQFPKSAAAKKQLVERVTGVLIDHQVDPVAIRRAFAQLTGGKQMFTGLTRNTLKLFQLSTDPFNPTVVRDSSDVYKTLEHSAVVQRIKTAADAGEMLVIIAEQGTGKTTAVNESETQLGEQGNYNVIRIALPETSRLTVDSIVNQICVEYNVPINIDKSVKTDRLRKELRKNTKSRAVCIVDNAHDLHYRTLIAIKQLWDGLVIGHRHLLAIILVCQDKILEKLRLPSLMEVTDHVSKHEMRGLVSPSEVQKYMALKLRHCNGGWQSFYGDDVPGYIFKLETRRSPAGDIKPRALNTILAASLEEKSDVILGSDFSAPLSEDDLKLLRAKMGLIDAAIIGRIFSERQNGNK
jgi:type II secretory pathway predicted ATPase ExeA